tara:strand:- start:877 stop:1341 length:465 start_codon:yes stop_codon:yes gene_type:complete
MDERRFNVRVYGILINDRNELLVSDELIKGIQFTKFPGGGLEWGEGIEDCLKREFMEELNQPIEVLGHYYTTDYFQVSAFNENDQLLSIYYVVKMIGLQFFKTMDKPFDFPLDGGRKFEVQRWLALDEISPDDFKWPVDKVVAEKIKSRSFLSN